MNLSFKNNRVALILIMLVLIVFGCATQTPNKQEPLKVYKPETEFKKLCDLLTPKNNSANNDLIKQWHKKVDEITKYTVEDHIAVIESLQKEQAELYEKYNHCDAQEKAATQNYSSQWLTDLTNKFGLDYLKENKDDVYVCLAALFRRSTDHYCRPTQEKMLVNESSLTAAYQEFCDLFSRYYNNLPKIKKALLVEQHKQALRLLDSIGYELNKIVTHHIIRIKMSERRAMRSNKELYLYMKNDLNMMTLDPIKAADDFRRLIK